MTLICGSVLSQLNNIGISLGSNPIRNSISYLIQIQLAYLDFLWIIHNKITLNSFKVPTGWASIRMTILLTNVELKIESGSYFDCDQTLNKHKSQTNKGKGRNKFKVVAIY